MAAPGRQRFPRALAVANTLKRYNDTYFVTKLADLDQNLAIYTSRFCMLFGRLAG
jgi:hypothetical protein